MDKMIEFINKVRSENKALYESRLSEATRTNIETLRAEILSDDNLDMANDFIQRMIFQIK
mgnify:FL=1